jgi:predicted RNase H-like HicB family nuclease
MNTKRLNYRIIIEKEEQEDGKEVFVAYTPSLGISDFGATIEKAVANMEQGIKLYIETLAKTNQPIPQEDTNEYFVTTRKIEVVTSNHAI